MVGYCTYPANRPPGWSETCMVDNNPKRPFWDNLGAVQQQIDLLRRQWQIGVLSAGVRFERTEVLASASHRMIKKVRHPVVALDCAPGKYPAPPKLDKHAALLNWSLPIRREAEAFVSKHLRRPFVAIHIRQAFFPSCTRDGGMVHSSSQCSGWLEAERGAVPSPFPIEICKPSSTMMEEHVAAVMNATGAASLFVASDHPLAGALRFLRDEHGAVTLQGGLTDSNSGYLRPQVDLAILTMADHMVGHCPSSFSHIAARMRQQATPAASVSYLGMEADEAARAAKRPP